MALSITQRLTITVAVLGGLILAPAGIAIYLTMQRGIEAKGIKQADSTALAVDDAILGQMDEDVLVDFASKQIQFDELRIPFDHWAVVRKNGKLEGARGIFKRSQLFTLGAVTQLMRISEREAFTVTSVHLVPDKPVTWNDIPKTAQDTVMANAQKGIFLRAKSEMSGNQNIYEVKLLCADHILDVEVTDTGELVETGVEELPDRLPGGMEIRTPSGQTILEPQIAEWKAYDSELIAIVKGPIQNGETVQVAVNRFGEQYIMNQDGEITQMLEDSRLWVLVAHDMNPDFAEIQFLGQAMAISGILIWLLIIAIAWQVTKRALRPVNEIVKRAERIDPPRLNERLPIGPADDELSRIARTVNRMLDRIQDGYQREQQFTGDVSHEMRNPLAKMIAEIDLALSKQPEQEEYEETLGRLRKYSEGMQRLIESLLILARLEGRLQNLVVKPFDVADLAMEVLKPLPQDSTERICLELGESASPMQAVGHRYLIGILLTNLVDNALRYSPPERPVYLRVSRNAESIHVEVEDEGPGIPQEQITLVFNRFHRMEKSRSKQTGGIGLGLSIVKAIADVHNTAVTLSSGAKKGTLATFTLPSFNHEDKCQKQSS